jgi:trans-aconitate methyltransferase
VGTEWDAATYRAVSALQEWLAAKSLASLTLAGDERVLDVGCGDGRISAAIAAGLPSGSVLGVDASQHMVDFAAAAFPPAEHPNLRFATANAAALALAPEFDLAGSFNALHWVLDVPAALRGLHMAMVPGGRALLRFVPAGTRRSLEDVIEDTCAAAQWRSWFADHRAPFVHPDAGAYAALARAAGFTVKGAGLAHEAWDFGSRPAFAHFAAGTFVAWTNRLPEDRRDTFIDDVLDRYAAVQPPPPVENAFVFDQLEIELEKPHRGSA